MCDLTTPKQREREEARLLGEFAEGLAFGKRFGDGVAAVGVGVVAGAAGLVSHGVVDENNATSHGASGRRKSRRSSCRGTGYTSRGGGAGARLRSRSAMTSTTTRIPAAIAIRSTALPYAASGTAALAASASGAVTPMPTATGRSAETTNT